MGEKGGESGKKGDNGREIENGSTKERPKRRNLRRDVARGNCTAWVHVAGEQAHPEML